MVDLQASPSYDSIIGFIPSRAYRPSIIRASSSSYHLPTSARSPTFPPDSFLTYDPFTFATPSSLPTPSSATSSFWEEESPDPFLHSAPTAPRITPLKNAPSVSNPSVSSGSGKESEKSYVGAGSAKGRKSTGRGGSGNIIKPGKLEASTVDEAEILRQRKLHRQLNPRARIANTGRGGTGNIKAASGSKDVPFDTSQDPDDQYEKLLLMKAKQTKDAKPGATGRGGAGNAKGGRPRAKSFGSSFGKKGKGKLVRRPSEDSLAYPSTTSSTEYYEMENYSAPTSSYANSFSSQVDNSSINQSLTSPSQTSFAPSTPASSHYNSYFSSFSPEPVQKPRLYPISDASTTSGPAEGQVSPIKEKKKWWKLSSKNSKKGKEVMAEATYQVPLSSRYPSHREDANSEANSDGKKAILISNTPKMEKNGLTELRLRLQDMRLRQTDLQEFRHGQHWEDDEDIINSYLSAEDEDEVEYPVDSSFIDL